MKTTEPNVNEQGRVPELRLTERMLRLRILILMAVSGIVSVALVFVLETVRLQS